MPLPPHIGECWTMDKTKDFISEQLSSWEDACERHAQVSDVRTKCVNVNGVHWQVMLNGSRKVSTEAKVDDKSIMERPCFLCGKNRPEEQAALPWGDYDILLNPYPVFPHHLTIVHHEHTPQLLMGNEEAFVALSEELEGYTVFYNGAKCGASAPDHLHFQGVPERYMPLRINYPFMRYYRTGTKEEIVKCLSELLLVLERRNEEPEPRVNVGVHRVADNMFELVVVPRREHRPDCYGFLKVSPGAIDVMGTLITTSEADFENLDDVYATQILKDTTYVEDVPKIHVGIMKGKKVDFILHGNYRTEGDTFHALDSTSNFTLDNVTIGKYFHWEKKERQTFGGDLTLLEKDDGTIAINTIDIESYLKSVISSEMSANASLEFLKVHAVISRSWAMAQIGNREQVCCNNVASGSGDEIVKWYDHEDHDDFDVCADDHCQRYQGLTRITRDDVLIAVQSTWGEVLMSDGELCDARFSKCCGGAFEEFENCWDSVHHSYLEGGRDILPEAPLPDLSDEAVAEDWIMSRPDAFCAEPTPEVLKQILNDYDLKTTDFYRWEVHYSVRELSRLIKKKSGIDFGDIIGIVPLSRGTSGRIYRLAIEGEKRSVVVGKELEIRRWLSPTHLYSSAFVVRKDASGFTFYGAGWGHGVGLCQIGAAVMAQKGYNYRDILAHYFKNAEIKKIY